MSSHSVPQAPVPLADVELRIAAITAEYENPLERLVVQSRVWEDTARAYAALLAKSLCGARYWASTPWLRCHEPAGHGRELFHRAEDGQGVGVYTWPVAP